MPRVSDKTKLKQKRCEGEGLDYIPWIRANETSSTGSSYIAKNYKSGRDVHLLSTQEAKVFFILLYSDEVIDIKEQYVLDLNECRHIAEELGYNKPSFHMSTDFYLKIKDPIYNYMAVSVKKNKETLSKREKEKLEIEKAYWERRGVLYKLVFGDDIDSTVVKNIRTFTRINKPEDIEDDIMAIKYLLTIKDIETNLEKEINYQVLLIENKDKVGDLYEILRTNEKRNWRNHREIQLRNLR